MKEKDKLDRSKSIISKTYTGKRNNITNEGINSFAFNRPVSNINDTSNRVNKSVQTEHQDNLRTNTFINVIGLFKTCDNRISIGRNQDQLLADDFEACSSVSFPSGNKIPDCICLPPDVMAYEVPDDNGTIRLLYNCPEINGTGFGGIRNLPGNQLKTVMNTYAKAAEIIKNECDKNEENPFIIVANSGREGTERINGRYPSITNSKMIWEKVFIADRCAEILGNFQNPCYADSLDKISTPYYKKIDEAKYDFKNGKINETQYNILIDEAKNSAFISMNEYEKKPLVLLGYSRDFAECCNIEDGRPYLFGRVVNGIVNDRAALNLSKKENKKLDYKKVYLMNATIEEGVNKFSAALARHEFHFSPDAKSLPDLAKSKGFLYNVSGLDQMYHFQRGFGEDLSIIHKMTSNQLIAHRMTYFRGVTEEEGIEGIIIALQDFRALNLNPLFKPNGTGQSKGIIGHRIDESKEDFIKRFRQNLRDIEKEFGKGAGYPFLVMPILLLAKTRENETYDLRFTIYQKIDEDYGTSTIHAIPLVIKKSPITTREEQNKHLDSFYPTNVTAAVAKTGKPGIDFIVPLCSENGMKLAKLSEDQIKSICLYFSSFQSWLLKTKYPR